MTAAILDRAAKMRAERAEKIKAALLRKRKAEAEREAALRAQTEAVEAIRAAEADLRHLLEAGELLVSGDDALELNASGHVVVRRVMHLGVL